MVKTFGAPRECGALGQLPLLHPPPPPLSGLGHWPIQEEKRKEEGTKTSQ